MLLHVSYSTSTVEIAFCLSIQGFPKNKKVTTSISSLIRAELSCKHNFSSIPVKTVNNNTSSRQLWEFENVVCNLCTFKIKGDSLLLLMFIATPCITYKVRLRYCFGSIMRQKQSYLNKCELIISLESYHLKVPSGVK